MIKNKLMITSKKIFAKSILFTTALAFFCVSCKKDNVNSGNNQNWEEPSQVGVYHSEAMQPFNDAHGIVLSQFEDLANDMMRMQNGRLSGVKDTFDCYTTTITPAKINQWPKTVTRYYQGCAGRDGKIRSGAIISVFSAPVYIPNATVTTTFEHFTVDSTDIKGTLITTNKFTEVPTTTYAFNVKLINASATSFRTGIQSTVNGDITYTKEKRIPNTFDPLAPFYTTGKINGENSLDFTWEAEVTKPILRSFNCEWPLSGVLSLQWNNNPDKASIDYGKGTCDNKAILSFRGSRMEISL